MRFIVQAAVLLALAAMLHWPGADAAEQKRPDPPERPDTNARRDAPTPKRGHGPRSPHDSRPERIEPRDPASSGPSTGAPVESEDATVTGTVFFNDRRWHGLFAARRDPNALVGQRCNPEGERDDESSCSINWLAAKYMVVDAVEIDEGFFAPTDWNCKKQDVIASGTVAYDGSFSITVPTDDPCLSDKYSRTRIKLKVRTRFCGSDFCFSILDDKRNVYALEHPGASSSDLLLLGSGASKDVGLMLFTEAGTPDAKATTITVAANYYASIVDTILTVHLDTEIPFYKEEFGVIEYIYPSKKSDTATAKAPDEVAISDFEYEKGKIAWINGKTPAHEYGHILMQRAWDGDYGFDAVGKSITRDDFRAPKPARQIAFKEGWANFVARAVFAATMGCDPDYFDENSETEEIDPETGRKIFPLGPSGDGAAYSSNVSKALCDWYDDRDDDDPSEPGTGDHFTASSLYSMWSNMRRMYVDRSAYGGKYEDPGLWFCDWVDYYLDVRKSASAVGAAEHASYEDSIRDLIYNNRIGCFMTPPS